MSAIIMEKISKIYNSGKPNQFAAVTDISLEIPKGQATILAGPSGSGKTTMLSLMGLMSRPSCGRITVLGRETTLLSEDFRTQLRRKHVGFIFQHFQLIGDLAVKDNLDLALYPDGMPFHLIKERRIALLEKFELLAKSSEKVSVLSGGEQQRLAIARALMNDPEIVLVDEPTAHLDTVLSRTVIALFQNLRDEGKTLVIASHDPLVLSGGIADRVIHVRDGRIIEEA